MEKSPIPDMELQWTPGGIVRLVMDFHRKEKNDRSTLP
jgi:hypothetical protein